MRASIGIANTLAIRLKCVPPGLVVNVPNRTVLFVTQSLNSNQLSFRLLRGVAFTRLPEAMEYLLGVAFTRLPEAMVLVSPPLSVRSASSSLLDNALTEPPVPILTVPLSLSILTVSH